MRLESRKTMARFTFPTVLGAIRRCQNVGDRIDCRECFEKTSLQAPVTVTITCQRNIHQPPSQSSWQQAAGSSREQAATGGGQGTDGLENLADFSFLSSNETVVHFVSAIRATSLATQLISVICSCTAMLSVLP